MVITFHPFMPFDTYIHFWSSNRIKGYAALYWTAQAFIHVYPMLDLLPHKTWIKHCWHEKLAVFNHHTFSANQNNSFDLPIAVTCLMLNQMKNPVGWLQPPQSGTCRRHLATPFQTRHNLKFCFWYFWHAFLTGSSCPLPLAFYVLLDFHFFGSRLTLFWGPLNEH